jgi:ribosome maturation factor RimP
VGRKPTFFFRIVQKTDTEKIGLLAREVARDLSLSLYDLEVAREGPRTILRVFVDREGGVVLSDIETFSRRLGALLEVEDPVGGAYVLEASSPGVNRRLRRPEHFAASVGRRVKVALAEPREGRRHVSGVLSGSDGEGITVTADETAFRIPYGEIRKASLEVTQEELFGKGKKRR